MVDPPALAQAAERPLDAFAKGLPGQVRAFAAGGGDQSCGVSRRQRNLVSRGSPRQPDEG
jgi:hypothetical protein